MLNTKLEFFWNFQRQICRELHTFCQMYARLFCILPTQILKGKKFFFSRNVCQLLWNYIFFIKRLGLYYFVKCHRLWNCSSILYYTTFLFVVLCLCNVYRGSITAAADRSNKSLIFSMMTVPRHSTTTTTFNHFFVVVVAGCLRQLLLVTPIQQQSHFSSSSSLFSLHVVMSFQKVTPLFSS